MFWSHPCFGVIHVMESSIFKTTGNPNSGVGDTPFYGLATSPNNGAFCTPKITVRNGREPLSIINSSGLNIILNIIK